MYSLLVLTLGCSKLAEQVPSFSSSGPEASSTTPAESQFETDLAPGVDLAIRVRGPEDSLPEALVVSSRSPMFGAAEVGNAPPEGTVLEISPAVEGALTVQDRWTLVFRPTAPFKPNTPYTVTLKSVVVPAVFVRLCGWEMIKGAGLATTVSVAGGALVALPNPLTTTS